MKECSAEIFINRFDKVELNGLYIFVIQHCSVCDKYLEIIKEKKYFDDFYLINCMEDAPFFMEKLGLDDLPYTILFKNNSRIFECGGILFNKQVNILKRFL